ncbi:hypothetical protein PoB_005965900 [Plakobranchus ocellatus]|uniref:Secreted protein n=1 Tax=Plakobranchus ocellatus TaxID=259542 RepID=A0AAV4CJY9_9GAST|nr:hypothetical protein PoB_005965900 [Plakobranchus ocellatus]
MHGVQLITVQCTLSLHLYAKHFGIGGMHPAQRAVVLAVGVTQRVLRQTIHRSEHATAFLFALFENLLTMLLARRPAVAYEVTRLVAFCQVNLTKFDKNASHRASSVGYLTLQEADIFTGRGCPSQVAKHDQPAEDSPQILHLLHCPATNCPRQSFCG